MTTRYEADLSEIEARLKRPMKGKEVSPAEKKHLEIQRQREKDRDARTQALGTEIHLSWPEGEPKKWDLAIASVKIGENTRVYEVDPYEERDGKQRLKPKIVTQGYRGLVEAWALWKWHSDRGSEVDDSDNFILDCAAPKMVWTVEEVVVKPKLGRPPREVQAPA